jgi:hypothetical protein
VWNWTRLVASEIQVGKQPFKGVSQIVQADRSVSGLAANQLRR